jgi:myo-inositol 2-dehydrogenase/D-chiro-inositol 1-dehydrogenase
MSMQNANQPFNTVRITRRNFLAGAGAATVTFSILDPKIVKAAEASPKLNLGLIGAGGRGQWILKYFKDHGGYNIGAVFDYFPDRAKNAGDKYEVPENMRFSGINGYKTLLEQKLDAVAIESPPYFHPEQAAAAVAAGKHVYLAKPLAVDVPGCATVLESGKAATVKKQAFLVDFQTRAHPSYQKAVKLVHDGKIGKIISGEATYQCSLYFASMDARYRKNPDDPEEKLRAWAIDRVLSGDIITEQNIHALDVASWILNAEPIKAYGAGSRVRPFLGNCWDRFACIFHYPDGVLLSFSSKQAGRYWDDIQCRIYGTEGAIDTHYGDIVQVRCDDAYNGGKTGNIYADGVVNNVAAFYDSIIKGDFSNPTVAPSVRSNLVTILGRTAAYKNAEVTWADMMKANEKLEFDTRGLKG